MIRVGIDTGGTFTDVAVFSENGLVVEKVPTTPEDPSIASAHGLGHLVGEDAAIAILAHGTTIGTNTLLQDRLVPTALVTTAGFRDVVGIGRQKRLGLYDLDIRKPRCPVPPALRFEVRERIGADGRILRPLDEASLAAVGDALERAVADGVGAVAIGFLHAYANPAHELAAEHALRERLGPGVVICRSSAVLPEFREHERLISTAVNAGLMPVVGPYVARLAERMGSEQRLKVPNLYISQSDGSLLHAAEMAELPVRSVLSGPASGVVGSRSVMEPLGEDDYITFDMGGTSTDICAFQDGEALVRREVDVGGYPVRTPALDIVTIGAGGGSIARVDADGHLKVGPESAGAVPGPAAYGRGGTEPTVTDATVVLGHLRADRPLAGDLVLDPGAAARALEPLADRLGLSLERTASGVLAVAVSAIERAVRTIVAGRGIDVRDTALCVFGGAGPLLAGRVARALGARKVVVPPYPGLLCAIGLLTADMRRVFSETRKVALDEAGWREGRAVLARLGEEGAAWLDRLALPGAGVRIEHAVDMRYAGQNHELTVELGEDPGALDAAALRERFERRHRELYAFTLDRPVDLMTWRAIATVELPRYRPGPVQAAPGGPEAGSARTWIDDGWRDVDVCERDHLAEGDRVAGPAVVHQMDATTLLLDGDAARVDAHGNLHVERV